MKFSIYRQSGVIPYRFQGAELQVLLITSRKGKRWIIPKGIVEAEFSPAESAVKEALEEAGVRGTIAPEPVGSYQYQKWGGTCTVDVFLMKVETSEPTWEEDFRKREWLPLDKAIARIREKPLRKIMANLPGKLFAKPKNNS